MPQLPPPSPARELNLDALVGPTHNYAGLARGNLASQRWRASASNPRAAALEGLAKMKRLADLGLPQAVLPPHERPDIPFLRRLGFTGPDAQILQQAHKSDPRLLAAAASASGMWAANAATVSPSADTPDARVHFTPANLISHLHRAIETETTAALLRAIFPDLRHFAHHPPLPAAASLADEGAANHTRLCTAHSHPGLEVFVHGRSSFDVGSSTLDVGRSTPPSSFLHPPSDRGRLIDPLASTLSPARFPARQTLEASQSIARLHGLDPDRTLFLQQHPAAIDAGVFHNDVIAVGNQNVLLAHESAFAAGPAAFDLLRDRFARLTGQPLITLLATPEQLSLDDAVRSYLFNSQLISLPSGGMMLIAPSDCLDFPAVQRFIDETLAADNPIRAVEYVSVRQSMRNGGGPACLRLRIVLTDAELAAVHPNILLTDALYDTLTAWVHRHYRDHLTGEDLADPHLLDESRRALDDLTRLLALPPLYPFQSPSPPPR